MGKALVRRSFRSRGAGALLAGLLAAILSTGCVSVLPGSSAWRGSKVRGFLGAAEEKESEPESRKLTPPPTSPPPPSARASTGLRFGYVMPGGSKEWDFQPSGLFGLYRLLRTRRRVSYELGLDLTIAHEKEGRFDSYLLAGRFDALFELSRREARRPVYVQCGFGMMTEILVDPVSYDFYGSTVGALNFGAGATFLDQLFDVRVTYGLLFGSQGATGLTLLVLGVSF